MKSASWVGDLDWKNYLDSPGFGITTPAFQSYAIETKRRTIAVRSMLSAYELALLYTLARDVYTGAGEIIDAGPLLGLSTFALARGLCQNERVPQRTRRIYSFDLFLDFEMDWYVEGCGPGTGSVFDRFLEINQDHMEVISVSPGDLLKMRWNGRPAEVLFIDVAKSWDLNAWVLRNWFPALLPGKSTIVQQDYIYFHQYWIALTMSWLRDYFERREEVFGASVVFQSSAPIPAEKLEVDLAKLPLARKVGLIEQAIMDSSPSAREVIKCGLAYCMFEHGERREARSILDGVRPIGGPDPYRDFAAIAESNRDIVSQIVAG
jgi:hypothetical protein